MYLSCVCCMPIRSNRIIYSCSASIYTALREKKRERKSQHIYAGCRLIHQLRQRYTYIHVSNDRWMDGTGTAICCSDESMLFDRSMDKWPRVPDSCCFNRCVVRCPCLFVYAWHYHYYEIDVYREAAPTSRWTITQFGCNVYSERKKGSYEKTTFVDEHFNKSIYNNKPAFIGGPVKWSTCHQPTRAFVHSPLPVSLWCTSTARGFLSSILPISLLLPPTPKYIIYYSLKYKYT